MISALTGPEAGDPDGTREAHHPETEGGSSGSGEALVFPVYSDLRRSQSSRRTPPTTAGAGRQRSSAGSVRIG